MYCLNSYKIKIKIKIKYNYENIYYYNLVTLYLSTLNYYNQPTTTYIFTGNNISISSSLYSGNIPTPDSNKLTIYR